VSAYRWSLMGLERNPYVGRTGGVSGQAGTVRLHRFLLGLEKGDPRVGDHRDGNGLDNRRSNLRITDAVGNSQNQRPRKEATSRYRGVYWDTLHRKWCVRVGPQQRRVFLGYFAGEEEAGQVARKWREAHFPLSNEEESPCSSIP
jgi:hypothetical protein